jgi:hypothetical protein
VCVCWRARGLRILARAPPPPKWARARRRGRACAPAHQRTVCASIRRTAPDWCMPAAAAAAPGIPGAETGAGTAHELISTSLSVPQNSCARRTGCARAQRAWHATRTAYAHPAPPHGRTGARAHLRTAAPPHRRIAPRHAPYLHRAEALIYRNCTRQEKRPYLSSWRGVSVLDSRKNGVLESCNKAKPPETAPLERTFQRTNIRS